MRKAASVRARAPERRQVTSLSEIITSRETTTSMADTIPPLVTERIQAPDTHTHLTEDIEVDV